MNDRELDDLDMTERGSDRSGKGVGGPETGMHARVRITKRGKSLTGEHAELNYFYYE